MASLSRGRRGPALAAGAGAALRRPSAGAAPARGPAATDRGRALLGRARTTAPSPCWALPGDRSRTATHRSFASLREDMAIDASITEAVRRNGARAGASLFATLFSFYAAMLAPIEDVDQKAGRGRAFRGPARRRPARPGRALREPAADPRGGRHRAGRGRPDRRHARRRARRLRSPGLHLRQPAQEAADRARSGAPAAGLGAVQPRRERSTRRRWRPTDCVCTSWPIRAASRTSSCSSTSRRSMAGCSSSASTTPACSMPRRCAVGWRCTARRSSATPPSPTSRWWPRWRRRSRSRPSSPASTRPASITTAACASTR